MDLAHANNTVAIGDAGATRVGRARFAAGIVAIVAIAGLLAIGVIVQSQSSIGAATQGDPFVGPAAVEFRAGERGLVVAQGDPFVGPAAVEFRAGERGLTSNPSDPFVGPAAVEFRAGERQGAGR